MGKFKNLDTYAAGPRRIFAYLMVAILLMSTACQAKENSMKRSELNQLFQPLLDATDAEQEVDAAYALNEALAEAGVSARLLARKVNGLDYIEPADIARYADAYALILVGRDVYLWKPINPESISAFFLE